MRKNEITVTLTEREQSLILESLGRYMADVGKARAVFLMSDEAWWGATREFQNELQNLHFKIANERRPHEDS